MAQIQSLLDNEPSRFDKRLLINANECNELKDRLKQSQHQSSVYHEELIWTKNRLELWKVVVKEEKELRDDNPMLQKLWDDYQMAVRLVTE